MWLTAGAWPAAQEPPRLRATPVVRLDGVANDVPGLQTPRPAPAGQFPSLPVTQLDERKGPSLDASRPLSLTFAQPMPVRDVLLLLFRGTPFSIVFDPAVEGSFTGELRDLTLRQALESVLTPAGLDYSLEGSVIHVHPRRPETRFFEVDYVDVRRSWQRRLNTATSDAPGAAGTAMTSTIDSDFLTELGAGVRQLLSQSGRHHLDRKTGVVQVTDFADRLDRIGIYLESAQLRAGRQVRVAVTVLEVSRDSGVIDWTSLAARAGSGIRSTPGSAGFRLDDLAALTRTLAETGAVRTIAAPHVLAMNNEPAFVRTGTAAGDGLVLTVTAQIAPDGIVQMLLAPSYSHPSMRPTEADTLVRVREGETVILAGLMGPRSELVLLVTPNVVTPGISAAGER